MSRRVQPFVGPCCDPDAEYVCCGAVHCAIHDDHHCPESEHAA